MPSAETVRNFVAAVVGGNHVGAIHDYYHDDATMQENRLAPRCGRDALMAHEAKVLARLTLMHTHPPRTVLVEGDQVMIAWVFDATDLNGVTRRLEEVAVQLWVGDRIQTERFYYDTASAWQIIDGGSKDQP